MIQYYKNDKTYKTYMFQFQFQSSWHSKIFVDERVASGAVLSTNCCQVKRSSQVGGLSFQNINRVNTKRYWISRRNRQYSERREACTRSMRTRRFFSSTQRAVGVLDSKGISNRIWTNSLGTFSTGPTGHCILPEFWGWSHWGFSMMIWLLAPCETGKCVLSVSTYTKHTSL